MTESEPIQLQICRPDGALKRFLYRFTTNMPLLRSLRGIFHFNCTGRKFSCISRTARGGFSYARKLVTTYLFELTTLYCPGYTVRVIFFYQCRLRDNPVCSRCCQQIHISFYTTGILPAVDPFLPYSHNLSISSLT